MKPVVLESIILCTALVIGASANAATYTAHYDFVAKPSLSNDQIDAQLQVDTAACDSVIGVQQAMPSASYRSCMARRGWKYRFLTRDRVQPAPADPNFASNAKLQPGHFIDHDNGMDCQNFGGAEVCTPPNGTVHYFDPEQNLNCMRSGLVSVCSNF